MLCAVALCGELVLSLSATLDHVTTFRVHGHDSCGGVSLFSFVSVGDQSHASGEGGGGGRFMQQHVCVACSHVHNPSSSSVVVQAQGGRR